MESFATSTLKEKCSTVAKGHNSLEVVLGAVRLSTVHWFEEVFLTGMGSLGLAFRFRIHYRSLCASVNLHGYDFTNRYGHFD